jgi:uncharacterized protein YegL
VRTAIAAIETRRQVYRDCALAAYRPWAIILSDGQPDPGWEESAERLQSFARSGWSVLCVGIGDRANLEVLQRFALHPVRRLEETQFGAFFAWLSDSLKITSRSHTTAATGAGLPSELPAIASL